MNNREGKKLANSVSWENRVLNPDALGDAEKKLWTDLEPILIELLDELKTNGKIEISFVAAEHEHLKSILDNLNQVSINHNLLVGAFDGTKKIVEATSEFGFKESDLVNLYLQTAVLLCMLNTELSKLLLLFHLKGVSHKVSSFSNTMSQLAPIAWQKLKPYVDSNFRNSLAHGTWALESKEVVLFDDAKLVPVEKLSLVDFMIKVKNQNVLFQCMANVIANKKNSGFFT